MPPAKTSKLSSKKVSKAPSSKAPSKKVSPSAIKSMPKKQNMKLFKLVQDLTKESSSLDKTMKQFIDSYEKLSALREEEIDEIDTAVKTKQEEAQETLDQMNKDLEDKKYLIEKDLEKSRYEAKQTLMLEQDQMNREFEQNEYDKAVEVLTEKHDMKVIKNSEYDELNEKIETAEEKLKETCKKIENRNARELASKLATKDLEHKVSTSTMTATIKQQENEIATLNRTIETLKHEIKEQRELTKSVASSGQKAVTQNFTK